MNTSMGWEYRQPALELRGYRPVQVLITCTELGVFEPLSTGAAVSAEDLSQRLGTSPQARNVVSWGALLNHAQQFVRMAWWMSAFPGLAITLTVLGLNLVADGLNEAWDPRFL